MSKSVHFRGNARLVLVGENNPIMKKGEEGHAVRLVQQALIDLGYKMPATTAKFGSPDGIYGSETKKQVLQFQKDQGLSKDGIVGAQTLARIDDQLVARRVVFKGLPALPAGTPGDATDTLGDSIEVIRFALGAANPLRNLNFTLTFEQTTSSKPHEVTIFGSDYDRVVKLIPDKIAVEIEPGLTAAALYLPSVPSSDQRKQLGLVTAPQQNSLILSRGLTQSLSDRSLVIHEATHAVCDMRKLGTTNALFSELLAFVAEAIFFRKRTGAAKNSSKAYQAADKVAAKLLKGDKPGAGDMDDLALHVRSDPDYGDFTRADVQYNGI